MCILVYVFFSSLPPHLLWRRWWVGGLCWWWCESRRSQPDQRRHICSLRLRYHHPPPQIPHPHLSSLFQKQKTKQTNTAIVILPSLPQEANVYLTRGDRINLCTSTLTHNLTLRPASLSVQEKCVFFFLFCLFFSLLGFSSFIVGERERTFSLCVFVFF